MLSDALAGQRPCENGMRDGSARGTACDDRGLAPSGPGPRGLLCLARDPAVRAVSLDVYDTLLLRGWRPELLRFRDIALAQDAALRRAGLASPGAEGLYRARLRIQKACHDRVRGGPGEVRHAEVVGGICDVLVLDPAAEPVLAEAEIRYETGAVRADPVMMAVATDLMGRKPVVLVSDMYLPATAVRRVLATAAPTLADLPLFVSADVELTKRHGALYGHVAAALDLEPREILHVGDNPRADVARAREAGLQAVWRPRPWWWRQCHRLADGWVRWRLRRAGAIPRG